MKKSEAIKKLGSAAAVARALNISQPSVSTWGEDIPELRAYQLRDKFPELFPSEKPAKNKKVA